MKKLTNFEKTALKKIYPYLKEGDYQTAFSCMCTMIAKSSVDSGIDGMVTLDVLNFLKENNIDVMHNVFKIPNCAFYECTELHNIQIPDNITSIGNSAFRGCTELNLDGLVIPDSVVDIGMWAFADCDFSTIELSKNISEINNGLFRGCYKLQKITIPDKVKAIGDNVFEDCESLEEVILPKSLTYIGSKVFCDCKKLRKITYKGAIPDWDEIDRERDWRSGNDSIQIIDCSDGEIRML